MMKRSFRTRLRAFQVMRDTPPDPGFIADLEFLENRDLDLSVRIGGMLAFNALMVNRHSPDFGKPRRAAQP